MTPILSFLPCAGASGVSERPNTTVAAISPHTKRTDRYGNMGPSQRASVGNGSARALEVGRRTMSSGWTADHGPGMRCRQHHGTYERTMKTVRIVGLLGILLVPIQVMSDTPVSIATDR